MPSVTGRLYPSEKDALRPPKIRKRMGRPPRPKPPASPVVEVDAPTLDEVGEAVAAALPTKIIRARPGGQLKASPEMVEKIVGFLRGGLALERAVVLAGVTPRAVAKWREANENLSQVFTAAEIEIENELIQAMRLAVGKDYKAAAWLLERRFQWEPKHRTEVTGRDGGPIQALTIHKHLMASMAAQPDPVFVDVEATGA